MSGRYHEPIPLAMYWIGSIHRDHAVNTIVGKWHCCARKLPDLFFRNLMHRSKKIVVCADSMTGDVAALHSVCSTNRSICLFDKVFYFLSSLRKVQNYISFVRKYRASSAFVTANMEKENSKASAKLSTIWSVFVRPPYTSLFLKRLAKIKAGNKK